MYNLLDPKSAAIHYVAHNLNLIEYPLIPTAENLLEKVIKKSDPVVAHLLNDYLEKQTEWESHQNIFLKNGILLKYESIEISELYISVNNTRKEMIDYIESLKTLPK